MEIDITSLLETDMFPFSHSQAEGGQNAGPETWQAALNGPRPLLSTPEEFAAFRDHVRDFGAWEHEEIDGWDENECQALFLQLIAGDVRQCPAILEGVHFEERNHVNEWYYATPADETAGVESGPFESRTDAYQSASNELVRHNQTRCAESLDEIDWEEYGVNASAGSISGNLFRGDIPGNEGFGKIFYSLSN